MNATRLLASGRPVQKQSMGGGLLRIPNGVQYRARFSQPVMVRVALNSRTFSSHQPFRSEQKPVDKTQHNSQGNPSLPAFSLDGLGISKNMKIALIGILCIFGTMETWVYCKWIWRWWKDDESGLERPGSSN